MNSLFLYKIFSWVIMIGDIIEKPILSNRILRDIILETDTQTIHFNKNELFKITFQNYSHH